jgi:hypothetical protein
MIVRIAPIATTIDPTTLHKIRRAGQCEAGPAKTN